VTTSTVPTGISPGAPFLSLNPTDLGRELDAYKAAGAAWIRVDVAWSTYSQSGWVPTDRVITAARSRGLQVLGILGYTPSSLGTVDGAAADALLFANYAAAATARYMLDGVHAWEIWNEPNLTSFWRPKPDPVAYVRLLQLAYHAIHATDPTATVIAGALSPATDAPDGSQVSPTTYLAAMLAHGAAGHMDALSVHPYCFPADPADTSTWSWNTFQRVPLLRQELANAGLAIPIWLTEFGAPTNIISEQAQAQSITDAYRLARSWGQVGPLFVYSGRDRGPATSTNRDDHFGLIRQDWSAKPSLAAFTAAKAPA
jgi:hypothetical protein